MGCALPYGIAAKLDAPDRPVVALVGDGAMQMAGLPELVTVADRWRDWADPRFVVLVLHNGDLSEVSWEQREMENNPRFDASQDVPAFPYAAYADLLGLGSVRITSSDQAADAWKQAFAADRPFVIEAMTDPDTPLLPPFPAGQGEAGRASAVGSRRRRTASTHARCSTSRRPRRSARDSPERVRNPHSRPAPWKCSTRPASAPRRARSHRGALRWPSRP